MVETYSRVWVLAREYTETANLSDNIDIVRIKELFESFNLSDVYARVWNIVRVYSETTELTDIYSRIWTLAREYSESLSLDDFFLNIIFDSLKLASARTDIQNIITDQGIEATLIRQTETTDSVGAVTAVSEAEYTIYMSIQDILREDRQIHDMGIAFPGSAKVFLFHEYLDSITGNGDVSVQVGDMIKDDHTTP